MRGSDQGSSGDRDGFRVLVPSLPPTPSAKRRVPGKDTLSGYATASVWIWAVSGNKVADFFGSPASAPTTPGSTPVIVTVHHNIAAFIAPRRFERPHHGPFSEAGQEIWYGPDGKVVKRIDNANSCGPPLGACS